MKKSEKLSILLSSLPDTPGIYQFYDEAGVLIYVGKAKNIKKRVGSYFNKDQYENKKTLILVSKINDIKYLVVDTEIDAFLLENSLIKEYQPKYNIQWRDDKTYPWICVKNERFPRVFTTRNVIRDGSNYYGPYASVRVMRTVLELIKQLYPLRNCTFNLSQENISKNKFKVCLEYHLGNCKGPCEALQSEEEYNSNIAAIKEIIKGDIQVVVRYFKEQLKKHIDHLEYEKAQEVKEKLNLLEKYQSKSTVVSPSILDVDVFSIVTDEKYGYVNFLKVINGAIVQGHTIEMKKKLDESAQELLSLSIMEFRQRFQSSSREIIAPFNLALNIPDVAVIVPQRGDKRKLLELSEKNLKYYILEKKKQERLVDPQRRTKQILEQMKKDLRLPEEPKHIECFDNSNFQGTFAVAAMSVYKDLKPSKKDYRHFNIKSVEGPDDFASMEEVVFRRYKRLKEEGLSLPQLIVVDGGKGQLSSAMKSLEKLDLRGKISIIGIAKRLEEIFYPGDQFPLYIDKKSETLKIIQQLRNEAHRFGITHHRKKREKGTIKTELTEIKGIGAAIAQKLLQEFKSVKKIKQAPDEQLQRVIGEAKTRLLREHFSKE